MTYLETCKKLLPQSDWYKIPKQLTASEWEALETALKMGVSIDQALKVTESVAKVCLHTGIGSHDIMRLIAMKK